MLWSLSLLLLGLWVITVTGQDCSKLSAAVSGGTLVLSYHDFSGLQEVGFHYNVNKDITGTQAADANNEVTTKSGDLFTLHTNTPAHNGDKVNLWLYLKVSGAGSVISGCHVTVGSGGGTAHTGGNPTVGSPTGGGPTSGSPTSGSPTSGSPTSTGGHVSSPGNRKLVWHEAFDGPNIDLTKWKHEVSAFGGGNWEFQTYTPDHDNSYIKGGTLYIRPTLLSDKFGEDFLTHGVLDVTAQWGVCTNSQWYGCLRKATDAPLPPILSAKLISKFSFKYGRMEVVAKMPIGDWIWPTIWLWPRDSAYGSWPRSGEIDLVETRGNRHYGNIGITRIMSTLHYGPVTANGFQDGWTKSTAEKFSPTGRNWADDFHTYFIDWTPDHIQLGVDNDVILNSPTPSNGYWGYGGFSGTNPWTHGGKDAPFDKEMEIQLNLAVGGTLGFFPDNLQNEGYPKPWCNTCPTAGQSNKVFWEHRHQWYPTWKGETCALQIKDVKVFQ